MCKDGMCHGESRLQYFIAAIFLLVFFSHTTIALISMKGRARDVVYELAHVQWRQMGRYAIVNVDSITFNGDYEALKAHQGHSFNTSLHSQTMPGISRIWRPCNCGIIKANLNANN